MLTDFPTCFDAPGKVIIVQIEPIERWKAHCVEDILGYCSRKLIVMQIDTCEPCHAHHFRRQGPCECIVTKVQNIQIRQQPNFGRQTPAELIVGEV